MAWELTRTPEQIQAFRDAIKDPHASLRDALLAAGYSESQACRGMAAVPEGLLPYLVERNHKLEALGRMLSAESQENVVRGRLLMNVVDGKDAGVQSAKLLGSDKRVAMFTPDSQVGVIIVEAGGGATTTTVVAGGGAVRVEGGRVELPGAEMPTLESDHIPK